MHYRAPYWLIPGDLLLAAPVLLLADMPLYKSMAIVSANGGVLGLQQIVLTPVGSIQYMLGRELFERSPGQRSKAERRHRQLTLAAQVIRRDRRPDSEADAKGEVQNRSGLDRRGHSVGGHGRLGRVHDGASCGGDAGPPGDPLMQYHLADTGSQ